MSLLIHEVPEIVDALPLIEDDIDNDEQKRIEAMKEVEDLMLELPPQEDGYIDHLPDMPKIRSHFYPFYEEKLERNGTVMNEELRDLASMHVEVPPPASSDITGELEIWNRSLDQIKIKIEYLTRQSENLEILNSHGQPIYEQCLNYYQNLNSSLRTELEQLSKAIETVNSNRRTYQEHVATRLNLLRKEWEELVQRNGTLSKIIEMKS